MEITCKGMGKLALMAGGVFCAVSLLVVATDALSMETQQLDVYCAPTSEWTRSPDSEHVFGGRTVGGDIVNVIKTPKGWYVIGTVANGSKLCLAIVGDETGDHLYLPIPKVDPKGDKS